MTEQVDSQISWVGLVVPKAEVSQVAGVGLGLLDGDYSLPDTGNHPLVFALASGLEWLGRGLRIDFVVLDAALHFDQVLGIEVVVLGHAVVVPSETLDGVGVVPEGQHLEMRDICFCAVQTPRPSISARRQILGQRNPPHQAKVFISLRNRNHSVPYSSDHAAFPSSEQTPTPRRTFSSNDTSRVAHDRSGSSPGS